MTITLNPGAATLDLLEKIWRSGAAVRLDVRGLGHGATLISGSSTFRTAAGIGAGRRPARST